MEVRKSDMFKTEDTDTLVTANGVQTGTASWKSGWVVSGEAGGPCSVIPDVVCVYF